MATARVLVVDDEPMILKYVCCALLAHGYEVGRAAGPREALELVRSESPFDVVLSDATMPEMQGPELVREITRISPTIVPILMSGYMDESVLPLGLRFIPKPFSLQKLLVILEEVLAQTAT